MLERVALVAVLALAGCGDDDALPAGMDSGVDAGAADAGADDAMRVCPTGVPDWGLRDPDVRGDSPPFPSSARPDGGLPPFLWGAATAAFQVEGNTPDSDWRRWEQMPGRIANDELSDDGPHHYEKFREDIALMAADGMNAYRFGIEWARIFPTRASFDSLTPDPVAVAHYHDVLAELRLRGIQPMVTIHHFVSPSWWIDPGAPVETRRTMGFGSDTAAADMARWATWLAGEYGGEVDLWITINEPIAIVLQGYLTGQWTPGISFDIPTILRVFRGLIYSHAAMYDAVHVADTMDADGDGRAVLASIAHHMRVMIGHVSCSIRDRDAALQLDYINNRLFLEAIVHGHFDADADGDLDDPGDLRADPALVGRADFLGVNYYGVSTVSGALPLAPQVPGVPAIPNTPLPLPKNDLAWDIYPGGFRTVLEQAATYGLPIYVTENGVADAGGTMRGRFLVEHLHVLAQAIAAGIDVRGYFHWSLLDNFEWSEGLCPRFGLYRVDYTDPARARAPTAGATAYRDIIAAGRVTSTLIDAYPAYGAPVRCGD